MNFFAINCQHYFRDNNFDDILATQTNFAMLFFHGVPTRPGQGFVLTLSAELPAQDNDTALETTTARPSVIVQPDVISVFGSTLVQLPLSKPRNGADLRPTFIIGHPVPGMRTNITVTSLETRGKQEWLGIFWFDGENKELRRTIK